DRAYRVRNARHRAPERVNRSRAGDQNGADQQSVDAKLGIYRNQYPFEKYEKNCRDCQVRGRNDGEKTAATHGVESGHAREAVSRNNRQRHKRGQDIAAELGAGNREKHEDHDEPDGQEARSRAPAGSVLRALGQAVVGAHGGPSKRDEENPGPRSSYDDRDEEPRTPTVFA